MKDETMYDRWTDRLSEYLDGELDSAERSALEEHLGVCDVCARTLSELREVIAIAARAPALPPERDLWAGIAQRIGAAVPEAAPTEAAPQRAQAPAGAERPQVPPLAERVARRRISFSIPQLAAAASLVLAVGAGSLALALRATGGRTQVPAVSEQIAPEQSAATPLAQTTTPLPVEPAPAGDVSGARQPGGQTSPAIVAELVSDSYHGHESAVARLEQALQQADLDTATVRVLVQSLATIDRAIAEARAALEQDPANPYLYRHLDGAMKMKVDLLRRAVSARRAAS